MDGEKIVSLDALEKSWNDSTSLLKSILGEEDTDQKKSLEKAKKETDDEEEDGVEIDEGAEGSEEEGEESDNPEGEGNDEEETAKDKKKMKKSMSDEMEDDDEIAAAMDVEPFLRKFQKSFSTRLDTLQKANDTLTKTNKALAKALMALGDQGMAIAQRVEQIANAPVGTGSVIRKSLDRFGKEEKAGASEKLQKSMEVLGGMKIDTILEKAVNLSKKGELTSRDVAKIQMRLNKGMPIAEEYVEILTKEEK